AATTVEDSSPTDEGLSNKKDAECQQYLGPQQGVIKRVALVAPLGDYAVIIDCPRENKEANSAVDDHLPRSHDRTAEARSDVVREVLHRCRKQNESHEERPPHDHDRGPHMQDAGERIKEQFSIHESSPANGLAAMCTLGPVLHGSSAVRSNRTQR